MTRKLFPLWIRDEKPDGRNWQRLNGLRMDGMPDGFHTGGAWLNPESDLVYKPLDGRPYANSEVHAKTDELEACCAMAAITGHRNWWTETTVHEKDGEVVERRWLVRKRAMVLGKDWKTSEITKDQVLQVEQIIHQFNEAWWEIGDDISVAFDLQSYEVFILDLSTAFYRPGASGCYTPDDWWRMQKWLEQLSFENLLNLRKGGKRVVPLPCGDKFLERGLLGEVVDWPGREWVHVYASRNRPMSTTWARIDKAHYVHAKSYSEFGVHTWVVTPEPLNTDVMFQYELDWAWSPLQYKDVHKPGVRGTAPAWEKIANEEEKNRRVN